MLTRDLMDMIQRLPSSVHNVPFIPEDAYTGYLVDRVETLLGYEVYREINLKMCLRGYVCGEFTKWFYHRAKTDLLLRDLHERMKTGNTTSCDSTTKVPHFTCRE